MTKKNYKIESKGSLWEVTFENGCYSDWSIDYFVFSGNSEEEIWEFVKQWVSEGGLDESDEFRCGLVWGNNKYQFKKAPSYRKNKEISWETDYGDALEVKIRRLNVIYVNPK